MRSDPTTRIVLLDEVNLLRDGLVSMLERSGMEVTAATGDAAEFLAQLSRIQPQVAVIGLFVRNSAGLSVLREARRLHPEVGFLVIALDSDERVRRAALEAGALGFIDELYEGSDDLVRAIVHVASGSPWVAPHHPKRVASEFAKPQLLERLSTREREVLGYVAAGADNLKIAAHLEISERTVKAHLQAIYRKLESENRTQLALYALQHGVRPANV